MKTLGLGQKIFDNVVLKFEPVFSDGNTIGRGGGGEKAVGGAHSERIVFSNFAEYWIKTNKVGKNPSFEKPF